MNVVDLLICNCIYNEGSCFGWYVIVFITKVVVLLIGNCMYNECSCFVDM